MIHTAERIDAKAATFEGALLQEVQAALRKLNSPEINDLDVLVDGHEVSLSGTVSTPILQHKAECAILSLQSVSIFRSQIEVGLKRPPSCGMPR